MARFGEAFSQDVSKQKMEIYFAALSQELTVEELDASGWRALKSCRTFPTIALLLEFAGKTPEAKAASEKRDLEQQAEHEWDKLPEYMKKWGILRESKFHLRYNEAKEKHFQLEEKPEPLIPETEYALRQCGGYQRVALAIHGDPPCDIFPADTQEIRFIRKQFIESFIRERRRPYQRGEKLLPPVDWERVRAILAGEEKRQIGSGTEHKGGQHGKEGEEKSDTAAAGN